MAEKRIRLKQKSPKNLDDDLAYLDSQLRALEGLPTAPSFSQPTRVPSESQQEKKEERVEPSLSPSLHVSRVNVSSLQKQQTRKKTVRKNIVDTSRKLKKKSQKKAIAQPRQKKPLSSVQEEQLPSDFTFLEKQDYEDKEEQTPVQDLPLAPQNEKKIMEIYPFSHDKTTKISQEETHSSPLLVSTSLDTLFEMVEKETIVPLSRITSVFHVSKETALLWGNILSGYSLVDLDVPAFGEPYLKKKGAVVPLPSIKKLPKKKIFIATALFVSVVWIVILLLLFWPSSSSISLDRFSLTEDSERLPVDITVQRAFSGSGSYECTDPEGKLRYRILNTFLKVELVGGTEKVIIKNNKTYTFDTQENIWKESEPRERLALPGSGIYPKVLLTCREVTLNEEEFSTS